jgi:NADPH:quinone reductase-like Zn-dependent oxidoreductase
MQAIVQDTYGSPDVLGLREIDKPVARDKEVLVRVHAAGVDQGVWHEMTGQPYVMRVMGFGLRAPKGRVRGNDVAGTVEAVGGNVSEFRPGDEVFGACEGAGNGSFAEYACARVDRLAAKPANISFEQAAAVPVSGCTALKAVRDKAAVRAGQWVVIIGAGGGVGSFAVQLAKALDAEVTGVCSAAKADLVRSIGADHVIDYTREDFADGRRRYDVIIDTAGNRPLSLLRRALTPRGTLVIVGGEAAGKWLMGLDRQLRALVLSPFGGQKLRSLISLVRKDDLQELAALVEAGKITPAVSRTYPLSEAPEAIRDLRAGHARGKLVITLLTAEH